MVDGRAKRIILIGEKPQLQLNMDKHGEHSGEVIISAS